MAYDNERKWKDFLSSVKGISGLPSKKIYIKKKTPIDCLSKEFAYKLLLDKGENVKITGNKDVLMRNRHLDVKQSAATPCKHNPSRRKTNVMSTNSNDFVCHKMLPEENKTQILNSSDDVIDVHNDTTISSIITNSNTILPKNESSQITGGFMESERNGNEIPSKKARQEFEELSDSMTSRKNEKLQSKSFQSEQPDSLVGEKIKSESNDIDKTFSDTEFSYQKGLQPQPFETNQHDSLAVGKLLSGSNEKDKPIPDSEFPFQGVSEPTDKHDFIEEADVREEKYIESGEETVYHLEVPVDKIRQIKDVIEIDRHRDRDSRPRSQKSDMDIPCSKWNISNIAEYFNFDECVKKMQIPTSSVDGVEKIYGNVIDKIQELRAVMGSNRDSELLDDLKSISATEFGCRLVVDAIFFPVCHFFECQIEIDKNIDCIYLPNCRFDYCIKKGNDIIGCVETKSVKTLNSTSVAQAILELMILQTNMLTTREEDVDFVHSPVFAIITDGHRFIYIQLEGSNLRFEHHGDKIRVHSVQKEGDFKDILQQICFLVKEKDSDVKPIHVEQNNDNSDIIVID